MSVIKQKAYKEIIDYIKNDAEVLIPIERFFNKDKSPITKHQYGIVLLEYLCKELEEYFQTNTTEQKINVEAALNASVSALYFSDSSDYKSYHYQVVRHLTGLDEIDSEGITKLFKELNPEE